MPAVAAAQSAGPAASWGDVALGATFVRDSVPSNLVGWSVSGSRRTTPRLSTVVEVTRHTGDETLTLLSFPPVTAKYRYAELGVAGGARVGFESRTSVQPFAQLLVGLNRRETRPSTSNASSAKSCAVVDTALGADSGVSKYVSLRLQGGWRYLLTDLRYRNELRFLAAASISLGSR
jgi:hypothetical protein